MSQPSSNPIWAAMVERDGFLAPLVPDGARYTRRQELPRVLDVNGMLYLWRAAHIGGVSGIAAGDGVLT